MNDIDINYFDPAFEERDMNKISVLGLAYIGDGVFELLVRMWLISRGHTAVSDLHRCAVKIVNASAQRRFFENIRELLSEEELAVYHRGRNAKVNSVPPHSSVSDYHCATGLETLFGWLYLKSETDRIRFLFETGMENL